MTLTLTPSVSDAATLATERLDRNAQAAGLSLAMPTLEFCAGRDRSQTALRDGQWLAGCSVPRRAAEQMIRREVWRGRTLCLINPTHGQQIAAVLDRLGPTRALIVVPASLDELADALACVDFTDALTAGRLFFAADALALRTIFETNPGLPVPQQIVRLPDADAERAAAATAWAQAALGVATLDHSRRLCAAASAVHTQSAGLCVLAARHFRLWADAGDTLARVCGPIDGPSGTIDTDHPATAADAYLIEKAAAAGAVLAADQPRPPAATSPRPWVTWLTRGVVPPYNATFPQDALLLADDAWLTRAKEAGWPADRLAIARWPVAAESHTPGAPLALIADLTCLDVPTDVADNATQQLAWEAIRDELSQNPFALGDDARRYVLRAPARLGLPMPDEFPIDRFIESIVAPAYTLGVANWLASQKVAFTLHGQGWNDQDRLAAHVCGPVDGRKNFHAAVAASGGLIDPFLPGSHPIRSLIARRVQTFGRTPQRVLQDIATIGNQGPKSAAMSPLSRTMVEQVVR